MNLNHLAIFHAVAQAGSMTLGAEPLDISQPAVSKQVQELERVLDMPACPTASAVASTSAQAGEILADYARRLFALASRGGDSDGGPCAPPGGEGWRSGRARRSAPTCCPAWWPSSGTGTPGSNCSS